MLLSRPGVFLAGALAIAGCGSSGGAAPGAGGSSGAVGGATGGAVGGETGGAVGGGAGGAAGGAAGGVAGGAGGSGGTAGASGGGNGGTGGTGAGGTGGAVPFTPLGMNDVTILAPLPRLTAPPVLLLGSDLADDGTAMVPRALFDRLVVDRDSATGQPLPTLDTAYGRLQLVAVRFDLCDRHLPGVCPDAEDARLRLVFQPITDSSGASSSASDVGFHAFYAIRNDEIAGAVASLRDLAMITPRPTWALQISPALSAPDPEPYVTKLRAFVRRYGGEGRIVRLTMNAQNLRFSAFVWELRGVEKQGNAFADINIVGTTETSERVNLAGSPGYTVTPITDIPTGLLGAITQSMFNAADATKQRELLATLAAVDNPLSHTAETVPCVACHVSTVVMTARAEITAINPLTLPGRYTSKFDLSITGGRSANTQTTIRALGYLGSQPMISQRVANDTAQTLTEIELRYPAP